MARNLDAPRVFLASIFVHDTVPKAGGPTEGKAVERNRGRRQTMKVYGSELWCNATSQIKPLGGDGMECSES